MSAQAAADIQGWDSIADHRTGTAGDRRTAVWLAERAADADARLQAFPLHRWVLRECTLKVAERSVAGVPLFDGGRTGPDGVEARLAALPDGKASTPREGTAPAIGLGAVGGAAGAAASRALDAARGAIADRGATGGWLALVAVTRMNAATPGLALQNADRFAAPFGPPVLQVASEHEPWLLAAAQRQAPARLVVDVRTEEAKGWNVVARVSGTAPELPPLVVVTPKSSWWTSTAERGGGIAAWLALLRHFQREPPARTTWFVATSGHELGHLGLAHWLASNGGLAERAHAWLHLGANFAARGSRARLQAADAEFAALARAALARAGVPPADELPAGERPVGEARDIHELGGRYVSLLGSNAWFHHPQDRWPGSVDVARTERFVDALAGIASRLASRD